MKPEHEDPNNHVPQISDDDDWDDLDMDSSTSSSQLPPRRTDYGIPPKKETSRSHVRLHEPRAKLWLEDFEGNSGGKGSGENPGEASLGSKKNARKAARKTTRKAKRKSSKKNSAAAEPSGDDAVGGLAESGPATGSGHEGETADETRTKLPPAPVGRPGKIRVNTIGSSSPLAENARKLPRMAPAIAKGGEQTEKGQDKRGQDKRGQGGEKRRRRLVRGERSDWGENRGRSSVPWMLGSGVGIVAIVILAVFLSQRGKNRNAVGRDAVAPVDELSQKVSDAEAARMEALTWLANSQEEARELYGNFETAESPEELSGILFNPEENLPLAEKHLTPTDTEINADHNASAAWKTFEENDVSYGVLEGIGNNFREFTAYFREEDGALKLDWRATTAWSTASFEDLGKGVGNGEEIRGRLSQVDFYTYAFSEEKHRSFRLLPPGDGRTVWVYVERGSEIDARLSKLFTPSQITGEVQSEMRMVLSLERGPEESLPNQWIITDIKGLNWLEK